MFQIVLVGLAKLMCMRNYVPKEKAPPKYEAVRTVDPAKLQKDFKRMRIQELKYNKFQAPKEVEQNCVHNCTNYHTGNNNTANSVAAGLRGENDISPDMSPLHLHQSLESDVREIRRFIKGLIYKQKSEEHLDKIKGEWRAVALVLDRVFFVLYTLSIIVSLATMFPRGK